VCSRGLLADSNTGHVTIHEVGIGRRKHNFMPDTTVGSQTTSRPTGTEMTSTNRTTIATRASQCLAAAVFTIGLAVGAAAVASAARELDLVAYEECIKDGRNAHTCCVEHGGDWVPRKPLVAGYCTAPAPLQSEPGQTEAPPVLDPGQTGAPPVITAPPGPNSGTLG